LGKQAFCRVCNDQRQFTQCWLRVGLIKTCPECGFELDTEQVYNKYQPVCPRCEEHLEQPSFEYGLCDVCGSKYELMSGSKPSLLPNRAQRAEMNKHGKVRRQD
jgi:hypothetical protein